MNRIYKLKISNSNSNSNFMNVVLRWNWNWKACKTHWKKEHVVQFSYEYDKGPFLID